MKESLKSLSCGGVIEEGLIDCVDSVSIFILGDYWRRGKEIDWFNSMEI